MDENDKKALITKMGQFLDEEVTVQASVQEILIILGGLDITITTFEHLSVPDPVIAVKVASKLQLAWSLEARLTHSLEEVLHEYNKE